jgi:hypothetical protein
VTDAGDLWLGGSNRTALFRWGSAGKRFWASDADVETKSNQLDVWPDAVASGSRPSTRTEDDVSSLAVMADGTLYVGSFARGLARVAPDGAIAYVCDRRSNPACAGTGLVDPSVTALARDRWDGSLWIGHGYGGVTRLKGGSAVPYDGRLFGADLVRLRVLDVQVDPSSASRRVLVAFESGAVGIYTGD